MYIVGAVVILLLCASAYTTIRYRKRYHRKQYRAKVELQVKDLLARSIAEDEAAWQELCALRKDSFYVRSLLTNDLQADFREANTVVSLLRRYKEFLPKARTTFQVIAASRVPDSKIRAIATFLNLVEHQRISIYPSQDDLMLKLEKDLGFKCEDLKKRLQALVTEQHHQLEVAARSSQVAYEQLRELIASSRRWRGFHDYLSGNLEPLPYPSDWHDLVAKYVKNPSLHDFGDLRSPNDMARGSIRLMAADALLSNNYALAKVVLAYCNYGRENNWVAEEVGDTFASQLALLIEQHDRSSSSM